MRNLNLFTSDAFWSAIIGGLFVLIGTLITRYFQSKDKQKSQRENLNNFLEIVLIELRTLHKRGKETVSSFVELTVDPENPEFFAFHMSHNYFVIYDNNASHIGQLTDKKLQDKIVSIYLNFKIFSDSLKLYEKSFDKYYSSLLLPFATEPQRIVKKATIKANVEFLNLLAQEIKEKIPDLDKELDDLTNYINDFLRRNEGSMRGQ